MVGKLIKYELMRIARIAAVPAVAVLGLAVIFRISLIGFTDFDALRAVLLAFWRFCWRFTYWQSLPRWWCVAGWA